MKINIESNKLHGSSDSYSILNPRNGKGAGIPGKILSVIQTIIDNLSAQFSKSRDIMGNYGRVLTSHPVIQYLDKLAENENFTHCSTFAVRSFKGKKDDISILKGDIEVFSQDPKQTKLAIPMILPQKSLFERKHIVMVFIDKDSNTIEYFDSKGITGENQTLISKKTMKDVLLELAGTYQEQTGKSPEIQENAEVLQMNCHDCGAYVSWFANKRLSETAQEIISKGLSSDTIRKFREEMKTKIKEPPK